MTIWNGGHIMSDFVMIADANCALDKEHRQELGVVDYVRSQITFPDGKTHDTDLDWTEISADDYYRSMKEDKAIYKTGVPSIDAVAEVYDKYLADGKDILTITLSSRMSSTYNVFMQARKQCLEKYPDRKISVVDSLRFSTPIAMMYMEASRMQKEGKSLEEITDWLEANKNCYHQMGPMDDMMFLARTGRITGFKAFFGNMVGVNAMGDYLPTGIAEILTKVKGRKAAFAVTLEYVKRTIVDTDTILIGHTLKAEEAENYKKAIEEEFHPKHIEIIRVDMSCGANVGPGMVGVYYKGKPATEGLEEEKKIMEEIVADLKK